MLNEKRVATMAKAMECQEREDWEGFISCWNENLVQTVGDPEAQDVIPFFGIHKGFEAYKKCIEDYSEGHFKIQEYIIHDPIEIDDVWFATGDATYIFEPTGEIVHSKHLLFSRFDEEGRVVEGRRWMESIVYYKTQKEWERSQSVA